MRKSQALQREEGGGGRRRGMKRRGHCDLAGACQPACGGSALGEKGCRGKGEKAFGKGQVAKGGTLNAHEFQTERATR